ncbi:MAG: helix-turn-helix domain-containing protein, partial [Chloroflexi bacterium]|nr:helix-turn-helix domain-containing protein [Chloroflexota bacterium]
MSTLGDVLRRSREEQGLSIQHVSDATHISVMYLQALESEQMDAFPADVYARGFLRSYASFLGLDAAPLLDDFQTLRAPPPSDNA